MIDLRPLRARHVALLLCLALGAASPAAEQSGASSATGAPPEPIDADFGAPLLLSWVPPVYPQEAIRRNLDGRVRVRAIVGDSGTVARARALRSTDKLFEEAAVRSVLQWKFSPGLSEGRPVSMCVDLDLPFNRADIDKLAKSKVPPPEIFNSLHLSPRTPPRESDLPDAEYPDSLLSRHLSGQVVAKYDISPEGRVVDPKILAAPHADFVRPALDALSKATFYPARQGDLPVASKQAASLEFGVVDFQKKPVDVLSANGISVAPGQEGAYTTGPGLKSVADPVYPYDLLIAGVDGGAEVDFVIGTSGRAESIAVRRADRPDFGRAVEAALEAWVFDPASAADNNAVALKATLRWRFSAAPDSPVDQSVGRLLKRLRSGDTADMGPVGLDGPLVARYQVPPHYPGALGAADSGGKATIRFVIDRDGRCRMPQIVSASREEFGWAAATAVSQWVFDPPMRAGKPVDVRAALSLHFSPTK